MLRRIVSRLYRRLPVVRELREIKEGLGQIGRSLSAFRTSMSVLQASQILDFGLDNHPRYGDPQRLLRYQSQVCSQNGEDGIIHEIFRRVGTTNRTFAEVGVGAGSENNTAFLLSQGWNGFWIDESESFLEALENRDDLRNGCLKWLVSLVSRENIAGLFEQLGVPKEFDFLSLDIDQNTYYAWEGLGNFRPRVVVVEYNAAMPPDIDWKVRYIPNRPWNGTQNFGASLKAFEILGRQLGYSLVGCEFIGVNAFFVRDDLLADKFAKPFTSENHYEPPRYSMAHRRGHASTILDRTNPAEP
jgi:hypothetical protein